MATCPTIDFGSRQASEGPEGVQEAAELFMEHGCVLLKRVLSPDYVGELHRAFVDTYHAYFEDREYPDALKVGDMRTQVTIKIEGPFNSPQLYANDFVLPVLKLVLGEQMIVGSFGAVVSLPGSPTQHSHRDHPNIYELGDGEATDPWVDILLPPYALNAIVPLVPQNEITGTTHVWLGSHLVPKSKAKELPGADPVTDLGDCLLLDYRLMHAGNANSSEHPRPILYNQYCRPWFRDSRNYRKQRPVQISQEEFFRVPQEYRFLFNWWRR
jgi:hypothetical protein